MNGKKLTTLGLSALFALSLAACSGESTSSTAAASAAEPESSAVSETSAKSTASEAANEMTDGDGNTLVVYFSATGHTESVANSIADITGGDVFALEPVDPYTSDDLDWTNDDSRVSREYADESLRDVELTADTVDNWDDYDTVFLGYPIWWGIAAWPVDGFVEANDFTGKTVIPFCTSSSSGIGESGEQLAELADTGNWLEGQRFSSSASEDDVQAWIDGLGL